MALTYDVSSVEGAWREVHSDFVEENANLIFPVPTCTEDDGKLMAMDNIIHSMIFTTMSIGINAVKKSNCEQILNRIHFLEKVSGPIGVGRDERHPFKMEWVERCIGLKTNASLLTKAQFVRNHTKYLKL